MAASIVQSIYANASAPAGSSMALRVAELFSDLFVALYLATRYPVASLQIPSLNFFCGIDISQLVQTVQGWITALQNSIESGLVSQGRGRNSERRDVGK